MGSIMRVSGSADMTILDASTIWGPTLLTAMVYMMSLLFENTDRGGVIEESGQTSSFTNAEEIELGTVPGVG